MTHYLTLISSPFPFSTYLLSAIPYHTYRLIVLSNTLYSNRLICSPIVAGISTTTGPYICSMDGIGAQTTSTTYAVTGTASGALVTSCEALYTPGLAINELEGLVEKCMRSSLARDVMSGCSVRMYSLQKGKPMTYRDFFTSDV